MRRALVALATVAAGTLAAAPAQADRPVGGFQPVAPKPVSADIVGGADLDGQGTWAVAWAPRGAGTLRLALKTPAETAPRVVPRPKLTGLADADVELGSANAPSVAWADSTGVWVDNPFDDVAPFQVAIGKGQGARIAQLGNGQLAVYGALRTGTRSQLVVAIGEGANWQVESLGVVPRVLPYTAFEIAPWGQLGFALLRGERGRLLLERRGGLGAFAAPLLADLGIARQGAGDLGAGPGNALNVLFGGFARPRAQTGVLRFGRAVDAGKVVRRTLLSNLQCDASGNRVGVGVVGSKVRLLWGYGCDVGWSITDTAGRTVLDPFRRFPKPQLQVALFSGSGGGQTAVVGFTGTGRFGVQLVGA